MTIQYARIPDRIKKLGIPIGPVNRLIYKAGADRASAGAVGSLVEILHEMGIQISKQAVDLALHARRTTVTKDDILLATELYVIR